MFKEIAKEHYGKHGVEQKAPIQLVYRGIFYGAFRLLHLMLPAVLRILS
ncbi:MAG: hypothetical protein JWQ09_2566 [Segetibacter sp.]|nr:hypothetical protein [Segetibacter sp.]